MNQDPNNLNQNNFNTQGNNGVTNNQPLQNNQNFNVNQTTFNSQQQVNTDYQQITNQMNMQQPTPQPMNSFDNGNVSQNFNSKPPKKNNLGLIIGIVVSVIIIVIGIVFGSKLFSNNKNSNNSLENNVSENNNNENSNDLNDNDKTNNIDLIYTFKDPSKPVAFDYPNFRSIEEGTSQVFKNGKYVIVYCRDSINTDLSNVINELKEKFKNATKTHIKGTCDSFDIVASEKKEINGIEMLLVNGSVISKYYDGSTIKLPLHGYTFAKGDTVYELIAVLNDEISNLNQEEMEKTLDAMIKTLRDDR